MSVEDPHFSVPQPPSGKYSTHTSTQLQNFADPTAKSVYVGRPRSRRPLRQADFGRFLGISAAERCALFSDRLALYIVRKPHLLLRGRPIGTSPGRREVDINILFKVKLCGPRLKKLRLR